MMKQTKYDFVDSAVLQIIEGAWVTRPQFIRPQQLVLCSKDDDEMVDTYTQHLDKFVAVGLGRSLVLTFSSQVLYFELKSLYLLRAHSFFKSYIHVDSLTTFCSSKECPYLWRKKD